MKFFYYIWWEESCQQTEREKGSLFLLPQIRLLLLFWRLHVLSSCIIYLYSKYNNGIFRKYIFKKKMNKMLNVHIINSSPESENKYEYRACLEKLDIWALCYGDFVRQIVSEKVVSVLIPIGKKVVSENS